MLCNKRNLIYIHIPKTAGTSIEQLLFPKYVYDESANYTMIYGWDEFYGWLNHLTLKEFKMLLPNLDFLKYSIFTIVRNPWDRMVSEFFWKSSTSEMKIPFSEFVNCIYKNEIKLIQSFYKSPIAFEQHIKPQSTFFSKENEKKITVIKYENLQKEFNDFCINQCLPIKIIPKVRTSNHLNYKEYYDKKTIKMIEEIYQDDINRFNYCFS